MASLWHRTRIILELCDVGGIPWHSILDRHRRGGVLDDLPGQHIPRPQVGRKARSAGRTSLSPDIAENVVTHCIVHHPNLDGIHVRQARAPSIQLNTSVRTVFDHVMHH